MSCSVYSDGSLHGTSESVHVRLGGEKEAPFLSWIEIHNSVFNSQQVKVYKAPGSKT